MLSCGSIYTLGNISPYITSYYGLTDQKSANMIMPTIIFLNCAFVPFGTYLINRNMNPKLLIALTSLISIPVLFIASSTSNFTVFFALYAFAIAFQQGFTYMVPVHHVWLWFPDHPGLTSGIVIGGFGFGPVVWNNFATHIINPNDLAVDKLTLHYPEEVNENFVRMIRVLITCWAICAFIGVVLIFPGPVESNRAEGLRFDTDENEEGADVNQEGL